MICTEWEERFSIGNEELDRHHRHLIDLLNRAYTACMLNDPLEDLRTIIAGLDEYARYHFAAEERSMADSAYPGLQEQVEEHGKFIEKLTGFARDLEINQVSSTIELVELTGFLADWVKNHIISLDSRFGDFLRGGAKGSAM